MKKEEKTELTKEKIIKASMEEFGANGYAGATINSICNRHGISKGLLYHNFTGKDELYLLCVKQCFQSLITYLRSEITELTLPKYLELRFLYFKKNPICARIFFEALLQPPEALFGQIKSIKRDFESFNRQLYQKKLSEITLRKGLTEEEALEYCEIMQEMFNCYFSSPAYSMESFQTVITDHEKKLERMLDILLYGIVERNEK